MAKYWPQVLPTWWVLGFAPAVLWLRKRTVFTLVIIGAACGMIGYMRGSFVMHDLFRWHTLFSSHVQLEGVINQDPSYDTKRRRDFYITRIHMQQHTLPGQVRVHSLGAGGIKRGDTVALTGVLLPGFGSYQGSMPFATMHILHHSHNPIELLRQRFFTGVYNALPDPQASLGLGFLVGLKTQLPPEFTEQLQILALTHIVVASGYNLTILVRLSRRILARSSRFQALAGSVALMCAMLVVTGMSASMARASVVTSFALLTWYYGRKVHPVLLLLGSAAITAWISPVYLWHDVGWWLSFMAFAGVLLLSPLLHHHFVRREPPTMLSLVIIETLSAELLVEPIVMVVFGQFSVLGLLANVVVVPVIPLAMLLTFVAGLAGIVAAPIAGWVAFPAKIVLTYVVSAVHWLAGIPWAAQKHTLSAAGLAVVYIGVSLCAGFLYWRLKFRYFAQASVVE